MPKYIGQPCTSCRNVFKEGDEIVVCPECGSPYHKECYKREGMCINTVLHESGNEWHPEPVVIPSQNVTETVCPNCGTHNSPDSFFCTSCGASLRSDRPAYTPPQSSAMPGFPSPDPYGQNRIPGNPYFPQVNFQTVDEGAKVDDTNTAGDYMKYVGMKFYYYLPKFLKFAKGGGKMSINFAALLFPDLWFFYRKMPIYGAIVMILRIITSIPSSYEYLLAFEAMSQGAAFNGITSSGFMLASAICSVINWVVWILCGFFGNYLYYKKAKKDIDQLKATAAGGEVPSSAIAAKGGVSMLYVVISIIVMTILTYVIVFAMMATQMVG